MSSPNRFAGTAYIKADAVQYSIAGTLTIRIGKVEREGQAGLSGTAGYVETPVVPQIEVEVFTRPDLDLEAIEAITDATIDADLANGKSAYLRNAWTVGQPEVNAAAGTATIVFQGLSGDWA